MSQNHGTKGRRTPLTLGQQQQQHQHHHSKSNARKASSDSNSSSTTTADSRSAALVTAATQNNKDQLKMSAELTAAATITGPKSAKENALRKMQQQQQQRNNQSNTAVVAAADSPTSTDDVILIVDDEVVVDETAATTKKESKREKNGAKKDNNGTAKTAAAGHANGNGNGKAAEPVAVAAPQPATVEATVTESSRQKVLREKHEKEEAERAKQQEAREIEAALAAFQAQDDAEKATTTAAAVAAETADGPKTPEKARRTKAAVVTPAKTKTPTSKPTTPKAAAAAVVVAEVVPPTPESPSTKSTAASEDDIMEPLCMETESMDAVEPPASPPPAAAVGCVSPKASTGKILKFTQSPVPAAAGRASTRLSPFAARRRSGDLNVAAAVDAAVNLSTVSEQSNEHSRYGSPAVVAATNAATDESDSRKYSGSLRQITCRRSMRPLRELAMQQSTRETYRRTRTELDDYSISSTNVTVGSEIGGDQAMADGGDADADVLIAPDSPPVAAVRGRKRLGGATAGGSEPDLVTVGLLESPKKPRLDLSGFFGMMASPVTLLRNKFSRTSLLCSTPNAKKLDVDAVADEEDGGDGLTAEIEGRMNPEIETGVEEETAIVTDEDGDMQVDDTEPKALESEDVAVKVADQTDLEAVVAETVVADGEACTADNIAVDAIVVEGEEKPVAAATTETDDDVTVTVSKPKKLGSCAVM